MKNVKLYASVRILNHSEYSFIQYSVLCTFSTSNGFFLVYSAHGEIPFTSWAIIIFHRAILHLVNSNTLSLK